MQETLQGSIDKYKWGVGQVILINDTMNKGKNSRMDSLGKRVPTGYGNWLVVDIVSYHVDLAMYSMVSVGKAWPLDKYSWKVVEQ